MAKGDGMAVGEPNGTMPNNMNRNGNQGRMRYMMRPQQQPRQIMRPPIRSGASRPIDIAPPPIGGVAGPISSPISRPSGPIGSLPSGPMIPSSGNTGIGGGPRPGGISPSPMGGLMLPASGNTGINPWMQQTGGGNMGNAGNISMPTPAYSPLPIAPETPISNAYSGKLGDLIGGNTGITGGLFDRKLKPVGY